MQIVLGVSKKEKMKKAIIESKNIETLHHFFWYANLDYTKETCHPESQILSEKVERDYKLIQDALYLIKAYKKIGVDF